MGKKHCGVNLSDFCNYNGSGMRSICFVLSSTGNYTSHEPLRAIASLVSYPSWLFLQIPSHGPFYYLTSLHRCWDGGICALPGVSAGKTALRAGKEFAAMLKCIFVWASLMGVDKQHMRADTFALLLHWTAKVTHSSRFFCLLSFVRGFIAMLLTDAVVRDERNRGLVAPLL